MLSTGLPAHIVLSGVYKDLAARDYAILQDDVQPSGDGCVVHVRVIRQGHPHIQCGTVRIPGPLATHAGLAGDPCSSAVGQALILWLQHQSMKLRFALRVTASGPADMAGDFRFEEAPVQST
jgi:hypothetical protein